MKFVLRRPEALGSLRKLEKTERGDLTSPVVCDQIGAKVRCENLSIQTWILHWEVNLRPSVQ